MRKFLALLLVTFAILTTAHAAQSVTLAWNANTEENLTGYRLYWGISSRTYTEHVTVLAPQTTVTVTGFLPGITYFFAVTAFIDFGANVVLESDYSEEVFYTVPGSALPPELPTLTVSALTWTPSALYRDTLETTTDFVTWESFPRDFMTESPAGVFTLPLSFFPVSDPKRFFRVLREIP